jgi:hypothetical protein
MGGRGKTRVHHYMERQPRLLLALSPGYACCWKLACYVRRLFGERYGFFASKSAKTCF